MTVLAAELYDPRAIRGQLALFEPPVRSSSFEGGPVEVEPEQPSLFAPVACECGRGPAWHRADGSCFPADQPGAPAPGSVAAQLTPDALGLPPIESNPLLAERSTTP